MIVLKLTVLFFFVFVGKMFYSVDILSRKGRLGLIW